jgi:hypothetical protein
MKHDRNAAALLAVSGLLITWAAPVLAQDTSSDPAAIDPGATSAVFTGEPVNGFPNWAERVMLEWNNRSRVDPAADLAACPSGNCTDAGCYGPVPPLTHYMPLAHSARFHSDEMRRQNYFDHASRCTLPSNIGTIYPASCDGSASCACAGGTYYDPFQRMSLFGGRGSGEIIAVWGGVDPVSVYYLWMYESAGGGGCSFTEYNGHRWLMLKNLGGVGYGQSDAWYTGDFTNTTVASKIPSGAHDPQYGNTLDFWVNWYDTAGPKSAAVVIDGSAKPLSLGRGTQTNGAWHAQVTNLGTTACHRYYFQFTDSTGAVFTWPATGSYGAGPPASCPDWMSSRTSAAPPKGDMNGDLVVNAADVFYLVNYLFIGGPAPAVSGDVNGDRKVDVNDVFYLVNFLFAGGPAPV